jgi:hypothetical protein
MPEVRKTTFSCKVSDNFMKIIQTKRTGTGSELSVDEMGATKNQNAVVNALFAKYNVREQNAKKQRESGTCEIDLNM